jgi:hypothetical protein
MDLTYEGTAIGVSNINDMTLKPGSNVLDMRSITDIAALMKKIIADKSIPATLSVTATGNTSVYNGVHLPYYEAALKTNTFTIDLDVADMVKGAQMGGSGFANKTEMIKGLEKEAFGDKSMAEVTQGLTSTSALTALASKMNAGAGAEMLSTMKSLATSPGMKIALDAIKSRLSTQ